MRVSTTLKATLRALAVAGVVHATTAEVSGPKIRIEVPGGLSTSEFCEPLFFHAACKYIVEMYFDNQLSQSSCVGVPGNHHLGISTDLGMEPTTLATLPSDIIHLILSTAASSLHLRIPDSNWRPRYELLVRTSLISQSWREPSQALLAQRIDVRRTEVERWLLSAQNPARPQTVTLELSLDGPDTAHGWSRSRSWTETKEYVREVVRRAVQPIAAFLHSSRKPRTAPFLFHLTFLRLANFGAANAILPLFESSSSSLLHLDISYLDSRSFNTNQHLIQHFHLVAPTLERLSVRLTPESDDSHLSPLLKQLTKIESMDCIVDEGSLPRLKALLKMVAKPLRVLRVEFETMIDWRVLEESLDDVFESLEELHILPGEEESEGRSRFGGMCGKRGIKVSFGDLD
ncbi:hypothetical protein RQP46_011013 [Phenoliferia psychrophenolica]